MPNLKPALLFAALLLLPMTGRADDGADALLGRWSTENDASNVELSRCGEKYCGKIVWLKEPLYTEINPDTGKKDPEAGKTVHDRENPDKALQSRPLVGMPMLEGFSYEGDGEWEGGTIYDPKNGKTYKCIIKLTDGGKTLKVRGYIGVSFIGRTTLWKRVEAGAEKK